MLNLWVVNGSGVATQPAGAKCDGTGGDAAGDEICMYDFNVTADENLTIDAFSPAPAAAIVANRQPSQLRFNGGEPLQGTLGAVAVGQLTVSASGPGGLSVAGEMWVDTRLNANAVPVALLASAGANADGDDLCDPADPCISFANSLPLADANLDGIPNECQCGDFDGDGFLSAGDLGPMFGCAPGAAFPTDPAVCAAKLAAGVGKGEADGDGFYSAADVGLTFSAIPGAAFPAPAYSLRCPARPEGTPAP